MENKKIKFYFDSGFKFPAEHGFTVIFISSVIIGIILSFQYQIDWLNMVISLLFSFIVFLSNSSIMLMVKSKFKKIFLVPILLIGLFTIGLLLSKNFLIYSIYIFFVTGVFFFAWISLNFINRGHTTEELVVGSMTLTLFVPLIFINAIDFHFITDFIFVQILLFYWFVSGFTTQLILYVQYKRKFLSLEDFFFVWLCFLVSLIPFYYFELIALKTIILLIEPTVFMTYLYIKKPELSEKPVFKKIGQLLSIRLGVYIILLTLVTYYL